MYSLHEHSSSLSKSAYSRIAFTPSRLAPTPDASLAQVSATRPQSQPVALPTLPTIPGGPGNQEKSVAEEIQSYLQRDALRKADGIGSDLN